jgi:lipoprotein-releasing system permease protein
MRFELFVATRYLRAKRRQALIGVITAISIVGVTAGVASLIVALAINNGFRQDLQDRLLGSSAHVQLMRVENDGIRDWPTLLPKLEKLPHVLAGAPAIYDPVMISRGARARGGMVKGIIPAQERRISDLLSTVKVGSADLLEPPQPCPTIVRTGPADGGVIGSIPGPPRPDCNPQGIAPDANAFPDSLHRIATLPPIVLGKDLADSLGATVGSVVLVTSPQGELTPFGLVPKYARFKVVGIFSSGFYDYDATWAFTRLEDAQKLFALGDIVSVLEFKIDDIYQAEPVGNELQHAAGKGFMATNWMEQNRALFRALRLERVVTFITIGLIVFVAALNILISLIMMVMEKTKDIAVLMSMGAKKRQVRRIFMAQGMLVGVIGTVLGLAIGYALAYLGGRYHLISLSAEVYSIDYVPFAARVVDGVWVALVSLGVSFVATLYPSWSASRILPAEALRYE